MSTTISPRAMSMLRASSACPFSGPQCSGCPYCNDECAASTRMDYNDLAAFYQEKTKEELAASRERIALSSASHSATLRAATLRCANGGGFTHVSTVSTKGKTTMSSNRQRIANPPTDLVDRALLSPSISEEFSRNELLTLKPHQLHALAQMGDQYKKSKGAAAPDGYAIALAKRALEQ
jgi:hypothetical protein